MPEAALPSPPAARAGASRLGLADADASNPRIRLLAGLLALASIAYIVLYVAIACLRLGYPYQLEWVEGFLLQIVERVLDGRPIYVRPSLEFISTVYTPLYFYASALVSLVPGASFGALRLVSLLSSLGCFAVIFLLVRRETASALAGLLACGLFAATFDACGGWFDLARVDSFFLFLLLTGVLALLPPPGAHGSRPRAALAGILMGLAFLAKQTALPIAALLLLYRLLVDARRTAVAIGSFVLVTAGASWVLAQATDGWYWFYAFQFQSHWAILPGRLHEFWTAEVLPSLPVASALAALSVARGLRSWRTPEHLFPAVFALGMVGSSWMAYLQDGAYLNNLIPAFAAIAVLAGSSLPPVLQRLGALPGNPGSRATAALLIAWMVQLGLLLYSPGGHLPSREDREAGEQLVDWLESLPGPVFLPNDGYLARRAGKQSFAHGVMIWDIFRTDREDLNVEILQDLTGRVRDLRFAAVVESEGWTTFPDLFRSEYVERQRLFGDRDVFWPVAGARVRPEFVFVPPPPAP